MRLCYTQILLTTCLTCIGFDSTLASAATHESAPKIFEIAQADTDATELSTLRPGSTGEAVRGLQKQLKELGYYDVEIDGQYGSTTQTAVSKYQSANNLTSDGIAGATTRKSLQQAVKEKTVSATPISTPEASKKTQKNQSYINWVLIGVGALGGIGALLYLVKTFTKPNKSELAMFTLESDIESIQRDGATKIQEVDINNNDNDNVVEEEVIPPKLLLPEQTSRLAKVNIIDELIADLGSADPTLRRKAIWDLGQQGDSRAIQPLVDSMIDADSQQRSLILAALAEIGTRTLKPMNRALAISLQDESPQVRQNAIRDLTRVYDMMSQISQMLYHAAQDSDAEVQATARYALSQMNRIRSLPEGEHKKEEKN
jgi:peptidoglycan hydrolase-like protein with peptidoglycan-binding domain